MAKTVVRLRSMGHLLGRFNDDQLPFGSPSYTGPTLPIEICDEILSYLWDDLQALAACSLACRTWLPTTRSYMYRNVVLRGRAAYLRFENLLRQSPAVAFYVRRLFLKGVEFEKSTARLNEIRNGWPWIVLRLPQLAELTVDWLNFHLPAGLWQELHNGRILSTIATIRLALLDVNESDLQLFISACPRLAILSLSHTSFMYRFPFKFNVMQSLSPIRKARSSWNLLKRRVIPFSYNSATPPVERTPLDTLIFVPHPWDFTDTCVVPWPLEAPRDVRLRRLALCCEPFNPIAAAYGRYLLYTAGASLESLYLDVNESFRAGLPPQHGPNLVSNTNLVWLHINVPLPSRGMSGLQEVLSDIQPLHSRLRRLQINLIPFHPSSRHYNWTEFAACLVTIVQAHPRLVVTIYMVPSEHSWLDPSMWMGTFVESVMRDLPDLLGPFCRLAVMWYASQEETKQFRGRDWLRPHWC